jgi:hypothetical protein
VSFDMEACFRAAHLGDGFYGIEEGKSKTLIDVGPYTYAVAQDNADWKNDEPARERIAQLA